MSLILTAAPAVEPVSLADAKAHLRVDSTADDTLIALLIVTARLQIEAALSIGLIDQTWSWFLDAWPDPRAPLELPIAPVRQITALRTYDLADQQTLHPLADLQLDTDPRRPRLSLRSGALPAAPRRPMNGIEITMSVGFGPAATDVPAPIRQAILQSVAHLYEHRENSSEPTNALPLPSTVARLLAPFHRLRLI
jgi:uncharacterized phiE125 gp8 family phage protein